MFEGKKGDGKTHGIKKKKKCHRIDWVRRKEKGL